MLVSSRMKEKLYLVMTSDENIEIIQIFFYVCKRLNHFKRNSVLEGLAPL